MAGMAGREVVPDLLPRVRAAARTVADDRVSLGMSLEVRNALIVQAVDEGIPQGRIAEAAGVSAPYITKLILDAEPDAVIPR